MILSHLAGAAARAAVLLAIILLALPLLRRAPSSARRLLLVIGLGGALILPLLSALGPSIPVGGPAPFAARIAEPFREPLSEGAPLVTASAPAAPLPVIAPSAARLDPRAVISALWATGVLLVLARLVVGLMRSRALVRRASPAPGWSKAAAQAGRACGLRAEVRVTDELDVPAVTGVLAPVVLVPRASEGWSDDRRVTVLLHELAHVRQRDCLAHIVAQLACAVRWFDPLVWIAARRLRLEREIAADDAVLHAGTRATCYAEELLAIAGAEVREAPAGALGMARRSDLAERITAIVSADRARRPLSRARAALLVTSSSALLLAVACATPESPPAASASAAPLAAPAPASAASTIQPKLQAIADEELDRTLREWQGTAGAVVVLDPGTGEILANAGRASGAAVDVAVGRAYVTGSTLKSIVLAAALDEGVVAPDERFDCENGARKYGALTLHDAGSNGVLSVPEMLAVSTNVGFSKIFDRLHGDHLDRWLRKFHFGVAPALDGAAAGELPGRVEDGSFEGAVLASGESMTASPLQVAVAYAVIANDGAYVPPTLARRTGPAPREQLIKPATARTLVGMLEGAVNGERATGKQARINGVRVAGKTGTAELPRGGDKRGIYASFVGLVPAERPRFVVLVGVEDPREGGTGGNVAAPAFARIASRALTGTP